MTNQTPDRPDGDGLRDRVMGALRIAGLARGEMILTKWKDGIDIDEPSYKAMLFANSLLATPTTRDGAEGGEDAEWCRQAKATLEHLGGFLQKTGAPHRVDWREWIDSADKHLGLKWPNEGLAPASPKPAPDAMRSGLQDALGEIVLVIAFLERDGGTDRLPATIKSLVARLVKADRTIRDILAVPVPPADGALGALHDIVDAWDTCNSQQLQLDEGVEQSIEAGRAFLSAGATRRKYGPVEWSKEVLDVAYGIPSPAVAAEPVALANALEKSDWSNTSIGNKALIQNAIITLRASPPVRGDRETLYALELAHSLLPNGPDRDRIFLASTSLKRILSLPVPPGAGERGVLESLADWCSTERAKIGAVDGYDYRSGEEFGLRRAEIEITKRNLSRQAPHSSSETES